MADQEKSSNFEIAGMGGVYPIAVLFERETRYLELLYRPAQVSRCEGDFRFGHDTSGTGHGLLGTESARCASQQRLRPSEIAELSHRDASEREGGGVVPQGNPLQRA
jgi:hypothetical protein